jgi:hypothetical protein
MIIAKASEPGVRVLTVAFGRCMADRNKFVGGFAHCGNDDEGRVTPARADNVRDTSERFGRFERSSAKLHDDHDEIPDGMD